MAKATEPKILQIIPAPGWAAVFAIEHPDKPWQAESSPLVAWALVEDSDSERSIEGVDALDFTDLVEGQAGFLGYLAPGQDIGPWMEEAKKHGEHEEGKRVKD